MIPVVIYCDSLINLGLYSLSLYTRSPKQLSAVKNVKTTMNWLENIKIP